MTRPNADSRDADPQNGAPRPTGSALADSGGVDEVELELPYWRLDDQAEQDTGRWRLLRRIRMAVRPVLEIVREAAPRAAVLIIAAQLLSGAASAFGLLATTDALDALLAPGAAPASDSGQRGRTSSWWWPRWPRAARSTPRSA